MRSIIRELELSKAKPKRSNSDAIADNNKLTIGSKEFSDSNSLYPHNRDALRNILSLILS